MVDNGGMTANSGEWYASPWVLVSLRPQGGHAGLRAAAARHGARVLALSPWKLGGRDDPKARADLRAALAASRVIFTSPAAVRFAAQLANLRRQRGQAFLAVGAASAEALRRAGVDAVVSPQRMDSEGLLALPELQGLRGLDVGLVTAPDGRDVLAPALRRRGARLWRADVYAREEIPLAPASVRRLLELRAPACVALSSGAALESALPRLSATARARLLEFPAIAASERLAALAQETGFSKVRVAAGPRPAQLLLAAREAMER